MEEPEGMEKQCYVSGTVDEDGVEFPPLSSEGNRCALPREDSRESIS